MKILVIGSGGREHAIAWRLAQEPGCTVFATPGNPGIATIGTCFPLTAATPDEYLTLAKYVQADLTVVGPEAPLVAGVVDKFKAAGLPIFGPTQAAARLEGSKVFAKQVMIAAGVPTAAYRETNTIAEARHALLDFQFPVVLKADGLAAGKGVIIANNDSEAEAALQTLTTSLGTHLVIEEFIEGEEASFIVIADGTDALPLEASQDHKRIFDNDEGANTGGMGAYCDGRILDPHQTSHVMDTVIHPTLAYMASTGAPFTGFLYAGLMMTATGPKVLEFNVRLGDPETQCLLHRIRGGFGNALRAAANHALPGSNLDWSDNPSVCVVMAASGYPDKPHTGDLIRGLAEATATGAVVFHAGTRATPQGIVTAGGRVLGVTASGHDLPSAITNTYTAVEKIAFDGMQVRKDIGKKGLKRWYNRRTAGT